MALATLITANMHTPTSEFICPVIDTKMLAETSDHQAVIPSPAIYFSHISVPICNQDQPIWTGLTEEYSFWVISPSA